MCTNYHTIRNPYTDRLLTVRCNHCSACQQENANRRAQRIRNTKELTKDPWYRVLFITLTYRNEYLPYIEVDDVNRLLKSNTYLCPVFRDRDVYYQTYKHKDRVRVVRKLKRNGLGMLPYRHMIRVLAPPDYSYHGIEFDFKKWRKLKDPIPHNAPRTILQHPDFGRVAIVKPEHKTRIPVIQFRDFQLYIKRVNDYFKRNGITRFAWFLSAEYGSETQRPHAHVVAFIPKGDYALAKRLLSKAWPYDSNLERKIEDERKDVAKYAASYVNKSGDVPYLLQNIAAFAPKCSFSRSLGFGNKHFSFSEILQAFERRDFREYYKVDNNGTPATVAFLPPSYTISRYFPKFKGYSRFSPDEIWRIAQDPEYYDAASQRLAIRDKLFVYDSEVVRRTIIMLKNKRKLFYRKAKIFAHSFLDLSGYSLEDFPRIYSQIWTVYESNSLRMACNTMTDLRSICAHYDIRHSSAFIPAIVSFSEYIHLPVDWLEWNTHPDNINATAELERKFLQQRESHKRLNKVNQRFINV